MVRKIAAILLFAVVISCQGGNTPEPDSDTGPEIVVPEKPEGQEPDTPEIPDDPVPTSLRWVDFLDELVSWDAHTRYPTVAYTCRLESSRDRRSVTPGSPEWFANDDGWGYIRMEYNSGREEKVIFDENHPGVISRIWLTSFGSPEVVVRFYLNGENEPSFQIDDYNLRTFGSIAGVSLGEGIAQPVSTWIRGSSLYLPISYSKSCKITIQEMVEPISVSRYYQINYRRYPDDFIIETFSPTLLKTFSSKVKKVNSALLEPAPPEGDVISKEGNIAEGSSLEMDFPEGTAAISRLRVAVSSESTSSSNIIDGLSVVISFDGTLAVSCPLSYFFGTGRGAYYMRSWRFECDGRGTLESRWLMPYRKDAKLTLINNSGQTASVSIVATVSPYTWSKGSLYFHAAYHKDESFPLRYWSDYSNGVEWTFAHIKGGRGLYIGDVYTVNNSTTEWPGEGDEKIWVDDEDFPSHFGTGVEDYYSFCGYFRFNTPFSGEPRLDGTDFHGYNTHYRTRNLDIIPFRNQLRFFLEMEGHAAGTVDVESVVFWYGDKETNQ